jgi:DNA-binding protein HU-beta
MNKTSLIHAMAERTDMSVKDAEKALNACIDCIEDSLVNGEKVQLMGFGTFHVLHKHPRPGRNPKKPEVEIMIPALNVPVFKAGKFLKQSMNSKDVL